MLLVVVVVLAAVVQSCQRARAPEADDTVKTHVLPRYQPGPLGWACL